MTKIIDVEPEYVEVDGKRRTKVQKQKPVARPSLIEQMEIYAEMGEFLMDNAAEMAIGFVASKLKGKL